MAAALDDFPLTEDEDGVCMADGGKTMGDDKAGPTDHEPFEGLVDQALTFGVESGSGFVEQEDFRISEDGAGDGDALALTTGELGAARTDEGFKAFWERRNEVEGIRLCGCGVDFFNCGTGFSVFDIFANAAAEEEDFLGDNRDLGAKGTEGKAGSELIVEVDCACLGFVEAKDEREDGGFPGTRWTD